MSLAQTIAQAMARMEGFFVPGARAARNNNPINLRDASGRYWSQYPRDAQGFIQFPTPEAGWEAALYQVNLDIGRGLSLEALIHKLAPAHENNTALYISNVAAWTGLDRTVPIRDLAAAESGPTSPPGPSGPGGSDILLAAAVAIGAASSFLILTDLI